MKIKKKTANPIAENVMGRIFTEPPKLKSRFEVFNLDLKRKIQHGI